MIDGYQRSSFKPLLRKACAQNCLPLIKRLTCLCSCKVTREKGDNIDTFFCRVYIEEERLTPEAKTHLAAATLHPYNTSIFIGDINTEAAKSNAKIWVSLCSVSVE